MGNLNLYILMLKLTILMTFALFSFLSTCAAIQRRQLKKDEEEGGKWWIHVIVAIVVIGLGIGFIYFFWKYCKCTKDFAHVSGPKERLSPEERERRNRESK